MRQRSLPCGLSFAGSVHAAGDAAILADVTWVDDAGTRHSRQQIADAMLGMIGRARRIVLLDMFLYNDFRMGVQEPLRRLTREFTDALLEQKRRYPDMNIIVITDPVNTVYGAVPSKTFVELDAAGIDVVITDLTQLRDSNPTYSFFWRYLIRPFGNSTHGRLRNPFDPNSRVTLRSYLATPNFKANHRKTVVADCGDELVGLVTSMNIHDASSAHSNVGCIFRGAAVGDLLATETAVLNLCKRKPPPVNTNCSSHAAGVYVQVLTERAIKSAALDLIDSAREDGRLDLIIMYLADRRIIAALKRAKDRGVALRVLLDPNKDAFGLPKFGIPNRPVSGELVRYGIDVRWCHTHGEQCHSKMLLATGADCEARVLLGSANFTRRNLDDFNLETDVLVRAPESSSVVADAAAYFERLWRNRPGEIHSVEYEHYRDESLIKRALYRFMEATGFCTF